jgi:hypothetical protein
MPGGTVGAANGGSNQGVTCPKVVGNEVRLAEKDVPESHVDLKGDLEPREEV